MMRVAVSWSGGKESCLACYRAILKRFEIVYLLNMAVKKGKKFTVHGLNPAIIEAQSKALKIPLIQKQVTWDTYEREFKKTVRELKRLGIEGMVFGDIYIQAHRNWVENRCNEIGIKPILPLWGENPGNLVSEFINAGFKAIVVCVRADVLGKEWLGRKVDEFFVEDLRKLGGVVDLCGELGEYHTLVIDGPIFKRKLEILESKVIPLVSSGWRYWVLDVRKWRVVEK